MCACDLSDIYNIIKYASYIMHYTILFYFILCVRLALASTRVIYKLDLSSVSFCAQSSLGAESLGRRRRKGALLLLLLLPYAPVII